MFNIFRVQSDVCSRARVREYGDIRMAYEGGGSQYRLGGARGGRMELKHIELLEILTRTRSLSRAAVELGTSQPRLTQQLHLVEKELGVSLFHRSARGLTLSEAGSAFLPFAIQISFAFGRGRSAVSALSKKSLAQLRLGMSITTSPTMISEFLQEYHKRYPGVGVTLTERTPLELVEGLEGGQLDVCGGLELPETATLVRKHIFNTRLVGISSAVMNVRTRTRLRDFCTRPLVLTSRKCATRIRLDTALKRAGVKPRICMELDDVSTIVQLVKAGSAVSILPETLAVGIRAPFIHKIDDLDVSVTGYFLHPRNPSREAQDFMRIIMEKIAPRLH
jgi:DNA-binding transcriptional LysR family regulator